MFESEASACAISLKPINLTLHDCLLCVELDYIQENPNHMALAERIPKPSPGSYERTTQRKFPRLSATAVQAFVEENRATVERERCVKHPKTLPKKRVPEGERVGKCTETSLLKYTKQLCKFPTIGINFAYT